LVRAYEQSPVENLRLINCTINGVEQAVDVDHVSNMKFEKVVINKQPYELSKTASAKK